MSESVEVDIDELVLHGVEPGGRYRLGDALQAELARLIEEGGIPNVLPEGAEIESVDGGEVRMALRTSPAGMGRRVAGAVYEGLAAAVGGDVGDRSGPRPRGPRR